MFVESRDYFFFFSPFSFSPSSLSPSHLSLHPSLFLPPSYFAVATLTERINRLTAHLAKNKHDTHCKRQLLVLSSRRRRLLQYMLRKDYHSYRLMVSELALRPVPVIGSKHVPKVRVESHKQILERNKRLKNRTSRGDRGH